MRIFATLFTIGTLAIATIAQIIPWNKDLKCEACAIGGYRFCWNNSNDVFCCDTINDPLCVAKYNKCTDPDKFTAVYGDCDRSNFRDKEVCGNNNVKHVDNTTSIEYFNITKMPVGSSCTYKVFSNCSWPSFEVNSTEVDLWVTSFKGK